MEMDNNEIALSTTPHVLTLEQIEEIRFRVFSMFTEKHRWIPFARAVEAALRDAPQAEGWVMVPVEPTPEMDEAGEQADDLNLAEPPYYAAKSIYAAMLAARPSAPTAVEPDERAGEQHYSEQLTRAKRLLVDVWQRHPDTRDLIEARTGSWFVWGEDRALKGTI